MTTAFVLSGGASLGAVQVGMLQALADGGIWPPDVVIGTSVGAVNAGYVAGHPEPADLERLAGIWRGLRRQDVFPRGPIKGLLGFLGRRDHLVSTGGLRKLLEAHLTFTRLEDAQIPIHVVATDVVSGAEVILSRGPAAPAILASAAIPGVFAPQHVDGKVLIDGGVADNTPVSCAVALKADAIYVLPASYPCALSQPPPTALGIVVHAINIMVHARLTFDVARLEQQVRLLVAPPLCPIGVSPVDFSHGSELIDRAYRSTKDWLARDPAGPGQAAVLSQPG